MDLVAHNRVAYNRIAKHFALTRSRLWPEFNEFTAYIAPGQRVLDWGCGSGRLVQMLKNKRCEYFGVDQSTALLTQARRAHARAVASGWAHFISTATKDKVFKKDFFDVAFMVASFFHVPTKAARLRLLKKTWRELKPGGILCMTLWNLESAWAKKKKPTWKKLAPNDYLIPWKDATGRVIADRYYHHFSEQEISGLLTKARFSILKLSYTKEVAWTDDKDGRNLIVVAKKPAA